MRNHARVTVQTIGLTIAILTAGNFTSVAAADEAAAIAEVEKLGGTVRAIARDSADKEVAFHLSGTDLTDEGLQQLKSIENVIWLNLRGTKITDAGLKELSEMKTLQRLHLEKTAVSDIGLAHLAPLENLEYLNLYETKVSDAGLSNLEGLKKLKKLYLWQTAVTKEGAEMLSATLPELSINRGADAEPGPPTEALAMGRYVKVSLKGEKRILQLAEVQVIETATGKELQTEGTASQSSDYQDATAERAKDGNVAGAYTEKSVSHTQEQDNPWWLIDLGDTRDIGKIVVHNRADCCGDRLEAAVVEVFDGSLSVVWNGEIKEASDGSTQEFVAE